MIFSVLPSDFVRLAEVARTFGTEAIGKPPDSRTIGEKVHAAFQKHFPDDMEGLRARDWRNLPYAFWLDSSRNLAQDRELFSVYRDRKLSAIGEHPARIKRWARPLFFTYVEKFRAGDRDFLAFATLVRTFIRANAVPQIATLTRLDKELSFFDPETGPQQTARSILAHSGAIDSWLASRDLWQGFLVTPFAEQAYLAALGLPVRERRTADFVQRLVGWSRGNGGTRYPVHNARLAEALLLPWRETSPEEEIKSTILSFLVHPKHLGDPRTSPSAWHAVSDEAKRVILRWLTGRTLDAFFRVLEATADDTWSYRQEFWKGYYDRGHIEEAWAVLGSSASAHMRRIDSSKQLKYGHLSGGSPDQSVLLMRMGDIVFAEWSHSGRLRAQRIGHRSTPKMYQDLYTPDELRFLSLDFNSGQNQDPGLVHFSSASGGWQGRARTFIIRHLNLR